MDNLYSALIKYAPRKNVTPKENFLTQALLYLLFKNDYKLAVDLCRFAGGSSYTHCKVEQIKSQAGYQLEKEPETDERPYSRPDRGTFDLMIKGRSNDGRPFIVAVENKWDSRLSNAQLERYLKSLRAQTKANKGRGVLIFIGSVDDDRVKAETLFKELRANAKIQGKALLWSNIVDLVKQDTKRDQINEQFVAFLNAEGLGNLDPFRLHQVRRIQSLPDALAAKRIRTIAKPILNRMISVGSAESWFKRLGSPVVSTAWGRACIWFGEQQFISFGVLYNVKDHKTVFLDSWKPLEVVFRIQQSPAGFRRKGQSKSKGLAAVRKKFLHAAEFLEASGYALNRGQALRNGHTVLLAQKPFPWEERTAEGQADALLDELKPIAEWLARDENTWRLIEDLNPYPN